MIEKLADQNKTIRIEGVFWPDILNWLMTLEVRHLTFLPKNQITGAGCRSVIFN